MAIIMLSPSRHLQPGRCLPRSAAFRSGFTLVEIVIALAVLGTMAAGVYIGFNAINTYAVSSRLYSEAQTAAQNQIDLILSREPFDSSASGAYITGAFNPCSNKVPVELMTTAELDALTTTTCAGSSGPVSFPATPPPAPNAYSKTDPYYPYYPYYRDGTSNPNVLKKQAFIYHDPVTGTDVVKGVLVSTVTDAAMTMTPFADPSATATPSPLNTRRAKVSVTYNFRGRTYTVSMHTLRTADQ